MKLGRILRESLEGAVPRLVVVQPESGSVIDLATAEYERLLRMYPKLREQAAALRIPEVRHTEPAIIYPA